MNLTGRNFILHLSFICYAPPRVLHADDNIVVASDRYKSVTVMCFVWHIGIRIYFEVVKLIEGHAKDIGAQCLTSEG